MASVPAHPAASVGRATKPYPILPITLRTRSGSDRVASRHGELSAGAACVSWRHWCTSGGADVRDAGQGAAENGQTHPCSPYRRTRSTRRREKTTFRVHDSLKISIMKTSDILFLVILTGLSVTSTFAQSTCPRRSTIPSGPYGAIRRRPIPVG
jgi:hypothetical protein